MKRRYRKNVYRAYNKIAEWFFANRDRSLIECKYLDALIQGLTPGAVVLDVGCGTGVPMIQYLQSKNVEVVGTDASREMLKLARINFPSLELIKADMRKLSLNRKFDAVIAWHSFFHLPAEDQPPLFAIFEQHLNPGGYLLFTSGTSAGEVWGMNGGEDLFHASLDTSEYERLLKQHHFDVLKYVVQDPECGYATVWFAQYNP